MDALSTDGRPEVVSLSGGYKDHPVPMTNRSLFWLSKRNKLAADVVTRYTTDGGTAGGALDLAGMVIPAGGMLSMAGGLAAQAPTVYRPLVRELTTVYAAHPEAIAALSEPTPEGLTALTNPDSEAFGAYLASEFGQDFFLSVVTDMLPELGVGAATNLLPRPVRLLTGTGLSGNLAVTLTWRVGIMAILFFYNDWDWIESKSKTNVLARRIVGKPRADERERVSLRDLLQRLPHLHAKAAAGIAGYIKEWREADPALTDEAIRSGLRRRGVPRHLIDAALAQV